MELRNRNYAPYILLALLLSCGSSSYKYYGMDIKNVRDAGQGKLLGPDPKDDLPLSVCAPRADKKNPCVVLKAEEFFKALRDIRELETRLKACEKN